LDFMLFSTLLVEPVASGDRKLYREGAMSLVTSRILDFRGKFRIVNGFDVIALD